MAGFDEVPFELIAERNHFCNLIANQQNAAISICRQVYLQGSQLFFIIFLQMYSLLKYYYTYALTKKWNPAYTPAQIPEAGGQQDVG